jgi:hypothetical protein
LWLINLTFLNSYHNMQLKKTEIAVVVSPTFLHFVFCFVKFYLLFCRCELFKLTKIKWFLFHRFSFVMVILFKPLNISMFSSLELNLNSLYVVRVYPLLLAYKIKFEFKSFLKEKSLNSNINFASSIFFEV